MIELSSVQALSPVRAIESPGVQQRAVETSSSSIAAHEQPARQQQDGAQSSLGQSSANTGQQAAVIELAQRQIQFAVDKETRRTIIKVIDPQTNEVIRQIPPEEALRISRMISRLRSDRGAVTDARV
ncbi:hypothetical protein HRbin20_00830 [bacterium HR20]|nr:hypothetical protein HRbin20_00830 [bacterium HR20]